MANIKIKLSQSAIDKNAQISAQSGNLPSGLAELVDELIAINKQITDQTQYANSWSASSNTVSLKYAGRETLVYKGTIYGAEGYSGTALAKTRNFTSPANIKETIVGALPYEWSVDYLDNLSYKATGRTLIESYKLETLKSSLDANFGKTSTQLLGPFYLDNENGAFSGKIYGITITAEKFMKSVSISGNFDISASSSAQLDNVNTRLSGTLSAYKENYRDGSFIDISASLAYDGIQAVDQSLLADASLWGGDDVFEIQLPANLNEDWLLNAGDGNDLIKAGGSVSLIVNAGNGDDIITLLDDLPEVDGGAGIDTLQTNFSYDLKISRYVENLTLLGKSKINGTGNDQNNVITGNSANNTLNGSKNLSGFDILIGGAGNDTYIVNHTDDHIQEFAKKGVDRVLADVSFTLPDHVEHLTLTGNDSINGTGNILANIIIGNSGNNIIDGGAGADTLIGGSGDDVYIVDHVKDKIVEQSGAGVDTVFSSVNFALSAHLENLTLIGDFDINAIGNALDNIIVGNDGNNRLIGGLGNDILTGNAGADYFVFDKPLDDNNVDTITDFVSGVDKIQLKKSGVFSKLITSGKTIKQEDFFKNRSSE